VPGIGFVKGHGTRNDFVVLVDPLAELDLTTSRVQGLCDRRSGIGGDGVLRAIRVEHTPDGVDASGAEWFMDYRNADGSVAEMCGNGIRVFVRVLAERGLLGPSTSEGVLIATRGGLRRVRHVEDDLYEADMGTATTPRARALPLVEVGGRTWNATGVLIPNPHAVVFVDDLADAGDLHDPPTVVPPGVFPDGVNVEFVVGHAPGHVSMRVHERGVGETQSCGTGACAAAWAWRRRDGQPREVPASVRVDVPGGTLWVTEHEDGEVVLRGPTVLVAEGVLDATWWQQLDA
jgi:diaminopimelate epimerase